MLLCTPFFVVEKVMDGTITDLSSSHLFASDDVRARVSATS